MDKQSIATSLLVFSLLANFIHAQPTLSYQPLHLRMTIANQANAETAKDLYRALLVDMQKQMDLSDSAIDEEVAKIDGISNQHLKNLAALLLEKRASLSFPAEFADEARQELRKKPAILGKMWSYLKRDRTKDDHQSPMLNNSNADELSDREVTKKSIACVSGTCAGAAVGGSLGTFLGGTTAYLGYTFLFLIASGIAGPLDGWYTWQQILIITGIGAVAGGGLGVSAGGAVGGGISLAWAFGWFSRDPYASLTYLPKVLALTAAVDNA